MLIISIKENESIDKALKRFKKKFEKKTVLLLHDEDKFARYSVQLRWQRLFCGRRVSEIFFYQRKIKNFESLLLNFE